MTWDADYRNGGGRRWPNEMLVSWVCRTFGHLSRDERKRFTILEVGCGAGGNLRFLTEEGFSVLGIDTSDAAVAICRDRGLPVLQRDILKPCLPFGAWNAVVDVTCLQHLPELGHLGALKEIGRLLTPDGRLWSWRLGYGTDYAEIFPNQPDVWLPRNDDLWRQVCDAGLSPIHLLHRDREYPGNRWARYLELEASRG